MSKLAYLVSVAPWSHQHEQDSKAELRAWEPARAHAQPHAQAQVQAKVSSTAQTQAKAQAQAPAEFHAMVQTQVSARRTAKTKGAVGALGKVVLSLTLLGLAALHGASAELLDDVKASGKLTIATTGVYAPYTYHDESGKLTGFDVEVGRAIAAKLGLEPVFIENSWDGLIAGIDAQRYDIAMEQINDTPIRRAKYDFSAPYSSDHGVLVVRKDNDTIKDFADLKNVKMAQTLSNNWGQLAETYAHDIVNVQFFPQGLDMVAAGRAAANIESEVTVLGYLREKPNLPLKVVAKTVESSDAKIPVRQGNPKFVAALNQAIEELRAEGTLSKLSLAYLHIDIAPAAPEAAPAAAPASPAPASATAAAL